MESLNCEKCDKQFVASSKLKNHMKSHKTITCQFCGILLPTNSKKSHLTRCQRNPNKEKFKCDQCDYETVTKPNLKCHLNKHIVKEKTRTVHISHLHIHHFHLHHHHIPPFQLQNLQLLVTEM